MLRQGLALLVFAALAACGAVGYAQSDEAISEPGGSEDKSQTHQSAEYARSLGDGLRHHAEGRFDQAVEHLFRAYARDSRAKTLRFIVDSYDQMGFCDAAARQIDIYERDHPDAQPPQLERCASTGALSLECSRDEATVRIDGHFEARCGQSVDLPAGEHRVAGPLIESARTVKIEAGEAARVELTVRPRVSRLSRAGSTIDARSEGSPQVERLRGPSKDYPIYQAQDGLYHIFVLPDSAGEAMFLPLELRPEVLRLCDSGERFDRESRRCLKADGLQIKKME
ncbi:MAG: hypothetical protein ACLFVJ_23535 [Persicimonas sp.]